MALDVETRHDAGELLPRRLRPRGLRPDRSRLRRLSGSRLPAPAAWIVGLACLASVGAAACSGFPGSGGGCGGFALGAPACTHGPTADPGALSEAAAIAAARRVAPSASGIPTVVWATIDHDPFAPPRSAGAPLVWEVRLQGAFTASPCPSGFLDQPVTPSDPACLDQASGLVVVLDEHSGALLGWVH